LLAGLYEFPSRENIIEDKTVLLDLSHSVLNDLLVNPPPRYENLKGRRLTILHGDENLRVTKVQDLGNTVHTFSHIKKTYRIFSIILQGGSSPPPLRNDLRQQKAKKEKTHDVSTDNNIGARAKWVPEQEVGNAK